MLAPALLLLCVVVYYVCAFYARLRRLPPGPTPLPLVHMRAAVAMYLTAIDATTRRLGLLFLTDHRARRPSEICWRSIGRDPT